VVEQGCVLEPFIAAAHDGKAYGSMDCPAALAAGPSLLMAAAIGQSDHIVAWFGDGKKVKEKIAPPAG
jgi:hypothetical protein